MAAYMHPQAVLIDSSAGEQHWFLAGVRDQVQGQNIALIELPERPLDRLGWLTKLDSGSLAGKSCFSHAGRLLLTMCRMEQGHLRHHCAGPF